MNDVLDELHQIFVEGMRKEMKVPDDWIYHSSCLTKEDYFKFEEIVGVENTSFVSGGFKNDVIRFSVFVSPSGVERARNWSVSSTE